MSLSTEQLRCVVGSAKKKKKIIVTKKCMSEGTPTVITFDSESRNKGLLTS